MSAHASTLRAQPAAPLAERPAPAARSQRPLCPVRAITLTRNRIYILPTRHGVGFALVLLAMLIGAANYENGLGYALTFLISSLGLVSIVHTYRNLAGITVSAKPSAPVFAGRPAHFELELRNPSQRLREAVSVRATGERDPGQVVRVDLAALAACPIGLSRASTTRGWLPLGDITIATRYPLGLFRAWSSCQLAARCLVYPAPCADGPLPQRLSAGDGAVESANGVGSEDFSGLRDYVPGDSLKRIHWKTVARGRAVPVKMFSATSGADLLLRWRDTCGDTEQRLSQLCHRVLLSAQAGRRFGLELPGFALPIGSGKAHRHAALTALALFEQRTC